MNPFSYQVPPLGENMIVRRRSFCPLRRSFCPLQALLSQAVNQFTRKALVTSLHDPADSGSSYRVVIVAGSSNGMVSGIGYQSVGTVSLLEHIGGQPECDVSSSPRPWLLAF